jgi:hypothetical protein
MIESQDNNEIATLNINNNDPSKSTFRVSLQTGSVSPVELISFFANVSGRNVLLSWTTSRELNNKGFEIQRAFIKKENLEFIKIGFVNGKGNSNSQIVYNFTDEKISSGKYCYRLKQIDLNGNFKFYNLQGDVEISLPKKFALSQNYPNPFNPVTKIDFDLPVDCNVSIKLYDITGREIKSLLSERKNAGYYTIDFTANNIASGIYFYRITTGSYSEIKKMALIK